MARTGQPSVMSHSFSQVPKADIQRSRFDRSHGLKTTINSGDLIPIFVDEALPGDTMSLNTNLFGRLATPIFPFMDNAYLDSFYFAVPYRLLWDNWERFNGAQDNPDDTTDYLTPVMTTPGLGGASIGSLSDYFGIPTGIASLEHSSLWHRAYNLIWNDWFRDENLQDSLPVDKTDGPDTYSDYTIQKRGKRHDYFTSSLPWPQKGPSVPLPLTGNAPITGLGVADSAPFLTATTKLRQTQTPGTVVYENGWRSQESGERYIIQEDPDNPGYPGAFADLSAVTAATINQLRQSFQIQRLYERDARGGTRYTELIRSHFGVTSPDARLQRPEYLGGGSIPLNLNPVAQTQSSETSTPQGNLAAIGTLNGSGGGFSKSFTEHCVIIGMVSVRADLNYQQGLNKMWSRRTRWDHYWPALAHIGEQAVLNKEIYAQGTPTDDEVFGYQERYAEYRYKPSLITGHMRSASPTPLDAWHLAQDFSNLPTLSSDFIEDNPPFARVIATPEEPDFLLDAYFKYKCARPMPTYSVPGMIDHF